FLASHLRLLSKRWRSRLLATRGFNAISSFNLGIPGCNLGGHSFRITNSPIEKRGKQIKIIASKIKKVKH
ncbi:hypothetical protein LINPERHAP1_LOCUS5833, partial [Linum perenne]